MSPGKQTLQENPASVKIVLERGNINIDKIIVDEERQKALLNGAKNVKEKSEGNEEPLFFEKYPWDNSQNIDGRRIYKLKNSLVSINSIITFRIAYARTGAASGRFFYALIRPLTSNIDK